MKERERDLSFLGKVMGTTVFPILWEFNLRGCSKTQLFFNLFLEVGLFRADSVSEERGGAEAPDRERYGKGVCTLGSSRRRFPVCPGKLVQPGTHKASAEPWVPRRGRSSSGINRFPPGISAVPVWPSLDSLLCK